MKSCIKNLYISLSRKKILNYDAVSQTQLIRCLSTIDLTLIGIGSTLGSGIYVLTGEVARNKSGPAIVISFFIAAFVSILSGLCYAEFGARVPKAGSAYIYCYISIGEFVAFIIAWNLLLEYIIGASAIARAVSSYIDILAGGAIQNQTMSVIGEVNIRGFSQYIDIFSFVIVMLFTLIHSFGIKNSARVNNFCVLCNLLTIFTIIIVGSFYAEKKNWSNFAPFGIQGIIAGSASCFFAFIGFDLIATTSEEAKNPSRSIPISMVATITVCFVAYFGVSAVITLMIPYGQLDLNAAVSVAFQQKNVGFMGTIISIGATAGLLGTTLISLVPAPRLLYALAQDGMFFHIFSRVNSKTGVPIISTVTSGIFIGLLAAVLDLSALIEMLSIGALLAYGIVVVCVLILRYQVEETQAATDDVHTVTLQHEPFNAETLELMQKNIDNEEELLIRNANNDKTCFDQGCTSANPTLVINTVITAICIELTVICYILSEYQLDFKKENIFTICILCVFIVLVFLKGFFLQTRETSNMDGLDFKVPFVPWLPIVALFFNILLTFQLSIMTLYRFVIWLAIGLIVYFSYSIHYSEERTTTKKDNDSYILLQTVKMKNNARKECEKSPLISPVKLE